MTTVYCNVLDCYSNEFGLCTAGSIDLYVEPGDGIQCAHVDLDQTKPKEEVIGAESSM